MCLEFELIMSQYMQSESLSARRKSQKRFASVFPKSQKVFPLGAKKSRVFPSAQSPLKFALDAANMPERTMIQDRCERMRGKE